MKAEINSSPTIFKKLVKLQSLVLKDKEQKELKGGGDNIIYEEMVVG